LPNTFAAQMIKATLAEKYGSQQDIMDALNAALKLNPNAAIVHIELAQQYYGSSQFSSAETEWETVISLAPNAQAYLGLARTLIKLNRFSAAFRAANAGLMLDAGNADLVNIRNQARAAGN